MPSKRIQSLPSRIFLIVIALGIVGYSFFKQRQDNKKVGELEYRMVSGIKDGQFQIIMLETADRFNVLDSAFRSVFDQNDAEVISRTEQVSLFSSYTDLQYRIGVHECTDEEKIQYRVNRELFNQFTFNTRFKYQVDAAVGDSVSQILDHMVQ